jgi:transcription elongation factor
VRVLNGPHAGERGMVVSVEGPQCVLVPDTRQAELKVFVRDLTEAKESGTGKRGEGGCAWYLVC